MTSSPQFEVYDPDGNLQATIREVAAAIKLADWYGNCATIRAAREKCVRGEGRR